MIQRIQSVYLSLVVLLSILILNGSYLTFTDTNRSVFGITLRGLFRSTDGIGNELIAKLLPVSALMILIPLLALVTILLFKNRKIQMLFTTIEIILSVVLILLSVYYSYIVISRYDTSIVAGFKMVIPVVILILSILAYRGIRKDDNLVKSYDRLR